MGYHCPAPIAAPLMDVDRSAPVIASAEAFVHAPPTVVWAVQSDLTRWSSWNPDVGALDLRGPLAPGTDFRWKGGGLPIRSTLQVVDAPRRIGWTGRAPLGLHAVHVWTFEAVDGGTRVRTEESFAGPLPRLLPGVFRRMLADALEKGLAALKAEAERRASAEPA